MNVKHKTDKGQSFDSKVRRPIIYVISAIVSF